MWELISVIVRDKKAVEEYLGEGYEPFAVTSDMFSERVWMKRKVEDETHSQQDKPKQGRSRKITSPAKD